jgi:small subunit ribosomal protein S18
MGRERIAVVSDGMPSLKTAFRKRDVYHDLSSLSVVRASPGKGLDTIIPTKNAAPQTPPLNRGLTSSPAIQLYTRFSKMSATETTATQSLTPEAFPFTQPELMVRYVTDTGKILPRKYTHLSAKQQRRVTATIKRSRAMLLSK